MEKTVKVDRNKHSSVVTFETGRDILKFAKGLLSAYVRYGKVSGAQMLVVERCTEHQGFARMTPRDKKNAKRKSPPLVDEAKSAAAGGK